MTVAAATPSTEAPRPLTAIASSIGIIVAVLTLPVVLLLGGPLNGWVLGVALWAANWSLQLLTGKLVDEHLGDRRGRPVGPLVHLPRLARRDRPLRHRAATTTSRSASRPAPSSSWPSPATWWAARSCSRCASARPRTRPGEPAPLVAGADRAGGRVPSGRPRRRRRPVRGLRPLGRVRARPVHLRSRSARSTCPSTRRSSTCCSRPRSASAWASSSCAAGCGSARPGRRTSWSSPTSSPSARSRGRP